MVDALCRTLSSQLVVLAQEGRQLECFEPEFAGKALGPT
jgi:hypothetical protein